ncbi:MAG: hypothetical protein COA90_09120 [Gammaproteobacteria bacterium]|nr:MAG: hypothetical protein COA90_09120 [Gammaproteobacteria bacterium]
MNSLSKKLIAIALVLLLDCLVFIVWSDASHWAAFGVKDKEYRDYLDLCTVLVLSFLLAGRLIFWLCLWKINYHGRTILLVFSGHALLGLVPTLLFSAGIWAQGVGEGSVFNLGFWHSIVEIFTVTIHWQVNGEQILTGALEAWLPWVLGSVLSASIVFWTFRPPRKIA